MPRRLDQPAGPRLTLPRSRRLHRPADFRRVYAAKQKFIDREIVMHALANGGGPTRFGVSVSRKVGGAVRRNRIKRVIREAFRLNQRRFPEGLDLVLIPRKGATLTVEAVGRSLVRLAGQAGRACRASAPAPEDRR